MSWLSRKREPLWSFDGSDIEKDVSDQGQISEDRFFEGCALTDMSVLAIREVYKVPLPVIRDKSVGRKYNNTLARNSGLRPI